MLKFAGILCEFMKYTGEGKTWGWIYRRVVLNFRVDVRSARLGKKKSVGEPNILGELL